MYLTGHGHGTWDFENMIFPFLTTVQGCVLSSSLEGCKCHYCIAPAKSKKLTGLVLGVRLENRLK